MGLILEIMHDLYRSMCTPISEPLVYVITTCLKKTKQNTKFTWTCTCCGVTAIFILLTKSAFLCCENTVLTISNKNSQPVWLPLHESSQRREVEGLTVMWPPGSHSVWRAARLNEVLTNGPSQPAELWAARAAQLWTEHPIKQWGRGRTWRVGDKRKIGEKIVLYNGVRVWGGEGESMSETAKEIYLVEENGWRVMTWRGTGGCILWDL